MLGDAGGTTIAVTVITTAGLVIVALIGVFTAKITSGARRDARANAEDASKSAEIARDFAAALGAKDALIKSIEDRLLFTEERERQCQLRLDELERRADEYDEQRRAASLIERSQRQEIEDLQQEIRRFEHG